MNICDLRIGKTVFVVPDPLIRLKDESKYIELIRGQIVEVKGRIGEVVMVTIHQDCGPEVAAPSHLVFDGDLAGEALAKQLLLMFERAIWGLNHQIVFFIKNATGVDITIPESSDINALERLSPRKDKLRE